jgi:signal transduction histidine kinase
LERRRGTQGPYEPEVKLSTRRQGDAVEIRVRDNGTGMPKAVCDKIFEPFFTTKAPGEGTGLGLSISYDIVVQQHGGGLRVESEPGEFTEFVITLPCSKPAEEDDQSDDLS